MNALTIQTKLDINLFDMSNVGNFIGKEVIITIIEVPEKKEKHNRIWNFLGCVNLNHQLDNKNIRDLAYD